jgi:uncharacterized protein YraI
MRPLGRQQHAKDSSMRDIRSLPIALAALVFAGGAAIAAPGLATTDVNMRQGPGTNFPVVTSIRGGNNVDVQSCDAGWCAVRFGPFAGFVKATYLDFGVLRRPRYYAPRRYYGSPSSPFLYGPPPPRYWGPRPYWGPGPYSGYGYGWRRGYWGW